MKFKWDNKKKERNERKHGVSFEEAETLFLDPLAFIFDDEWHSKDEEREIIIGYSTQNRLLIVCFTEWNAVVRLIRAREATRKEQTDYEKNAYF